MKYRSITTGAIIDAKSVITGTDWVPVVPEKQPEKQPKRKGSKPEAKKTEG